MSENVLIIFTKYLKYLDIIIQIKKIAFIIKFTWLMAPKRKI